MCVKRALTVVDPLLLMGEASPPRRIYGDTMAPVSGCVACVQTDFLQSGEM